jgi:hypothetical protein
LELPCSNGETPASGGTVQVHVTKPSGLKSDISLIDGGDEVDDASGDGIYSGFVDTDEVGTYSAIADISGTNSNGTQYNLQSSTQFFVDAVKASLTGTITDHGVDTNSDGLSGRSVC